MTSHPVPSRAALLCAAVVALAAALAASPSAQAQSPPGGLRPLQGGVRVQVFVDERRNATAKRNVAGQGDFPAYAYRMRAGKQRLEVRLDSDEIMRRWKGQFVLGQPRKDEFETDTQFIPALLVVDVSNEGGAVAQVAAAYLEVDASITERQPFMHLSSFGSEVFDLRNHGWGRAENVLLNFAFGRDRPATQAFSLQLGSLGAAEVSPIRAMAAIVPAVPQLLRQSPRCASLERVRACLQQLERTQALGRLADIAYLRDSFVFTRLIGTLSYQWRDSANAVQRSESPVNIELLLFKFDVGDAPEMGAPAPEESGFRPIMLPLDRTQYRLPLPYRPRVGPGENRRFELTLAAPKSSQHLLRVVVEMTDGSRSVSAPIDLLYFKPLIDIGQARQIR